MRDIKLPQVRLELARMLRTRHKFVCFDFTSRVDIDCARLSRLSLCQGSSVRVARETDFISQIKKP